MYTRCDSCQAVYPLDADLLAEAAGIVRCGNCGKTFNSLTQLFDHRPLEDDEPLKGDGMPPLLDHPELIQAELPVSMEPEPDDDPAEDTAMPGTETGADPGERPERHPAWALACIALLAVLTLQTWHLTRTPGTPVARWFGGAEPAASVNPNEAIQIVSRDMHAHPSLDDAVVISASLRNQERHSISFPELEVRLYDVSQQVIGMRRLTPEEYLADPEAIDHGMAPDVLIPVLLEFIVGSTEPAGFQLRFH